MGVGGNTNNITVNVQGRVGSSDSELRQIAEKVGAMINKEINRTTSSGTMRWGYGKLCLFKVRRRKTKR